MSLEINIEFHRPKSEISPADLARLQTLVSQIREVFENSDLPEDVANDENRVQLISVSIRKKRNQSNPNQLEIAHDAKNEKD